MKRNYNIFLSYFNWLESLIFHKCVSFNSLFIKKIRYIFTCPMHAKVANWLHSKPGWLRPNFKLAIVKLR